MAGFSTLFPGCFEQLEARAFLRSVSNLLRPGLSPILNLQYLLGVQRSKSVVVSEACARFRSADTVKPRYNDWLGAANI